MKFVLLPFILTKSKPRSNAAGFDPSGNLKMDMQACPSLFSDSSISFYNNPSIAKEQEITGREA